MGDEMFSNMPVRVHDVTPKRRLKVNKDEPPAKKPRSPAGKGGSKKSAPKEKKTQPPSKTVEKKKQPVKKRGKKFEIEGAVI